MEYREMVKKIPRTMRGALSEKLMDCLLETKEGSTVPASLAKTILYYWQRDRLDTQAGLTNLLHATVIADPEKAAKIMYDMGLEEISIALRQV
jgi:hypothetical protein